MKTNTIMLATASVLSLGLALQATSGTGVSVSQDQQKQTPRTNNVVKVLTTADDDSQDAKVERHTISVTNDNGDVRVIVNGKEVPADQIEVADDGIIVLDKDGNVIKSIDMSIDWTDEHFGQWSKIADFLEEDWTDLKGGIVLDGENLAFGQFDPENMAFDFAFGGEHPDVMLGVFLDEPGEALRRHLRIDGDATIISELMEGLPADQAGLEQYDIIIAVDGDEPAGPDAIHKVLAEKKPGDTITLRVIQRGEKKTVDVTLSEYDPEKMMRFQSIGVFDTKERARNRWFVSPPEFEFGDIDGRIVLPENLKGNIQVFVHPEGIEEVLDLPDFEVDIDTDAIHKAIREAIEGGKVNLDLHEDALRHLEDVKTSDDFRQLVMPKIRVKELHDADEHMKKAIEMQLKGLELRELKRGDMKELHGHLLERIPKVQVQRSLEQAREAQQHAREHMPEIQQHLEEARQLHERLKNVAPDFDREIDAVKQRLDRLEELLQQLLDDLASQSI